jgi:hypothetical protein
MFVFLVLFIRPHNVFHLVDKARYFSLRAKVTETVRVNLFYLSVWLLLLCSM